MDLQNLGIGFGVTKRPSEILYRDRPTPLIIQHRYGLRVPGVATCLKVGGSLDFRSRVTPVPSLQCP
jgi:hypothetical protein